MNRILWVLTVVMIPATAQAEEHGAEQSLVGDIVNTALSLGNAGDPMDRAEKLARLSERVTARAHRAADRGQTKKAERLALLSARVEERGVSRQLAQAGKTKGRRQADRAAHVQARSRKNLATLQRVLAKVPESARKGILRAIANASKAHGHAYGHSKPKEKGHDRPSHGSKGKSEGKGKSKGKPDHAGRGKKEQDRPPHAGKGRDKQKGKSGHAGAGRGRVKDKPDHRGAGRGKGKDKHRGRGRK